MKDCTSGRVEKARRVFGGIRNRTEVGTENGVADLG